MSAPKKLLILGGTAEARDLAERVHAGLAGRIEATTSLAGRLEGSAPPPGRVRRGGFGGAAGLEAFLRDEGISWVVDATHPFAVTISEHATTACLRAEVPRVLLLRPPWAPHAGDRWLEVADAETAARVLPRFSRRAFLAVGPGSVAPFADVDGVWFLVRAFEPPTAPLPLKDHDVVVARPPFPVEAERALLMVHRIDTVVAKNSGGGASAAKIEAARALRRRLVLIRRPPPEPGPWGDSVDEVFEWLQRQAG